MSGATRTQALFLGRICHPSIAPCSSILAGGVQHVFGSVPVFGGSAADDDVQGDWWLAANSDVIRHHGVLMTAFYPSVTTAVSLTSLHKPTEQRGVATRVSADGRTLFEIDNKPAAEVYDTWTGGAISAARAAVGNSADGKRSIFGETTLFPLAHERVDGDGQKVYSLIHPAELHGETGAISNFAEVREEEDITLLSLKSVGELVSTVEDATASAVKWAHFRPTGALLIYCAGCFLAARPHIGSVYERIKRGLGSEQAAAGMSSPPLPCPPFVCGFTFGEQVTACPQTQPLAQAFH